MTLEDMETLGLWLWLCRLWIGREERAPFRVEVAGWWDPGLELPSKSVQGRTCGGVAAEGSGFGSHRTWQSA